MKKVLSFFIVLSLACTLMAQTVTLTFTGRDANNNYCQLNRVVVTNLTKSWQETIYWPDTTLSMQASTGIGDYVSGNEFVLSQNNPNPFNGTTEANLAIPESGEIVMQIVDINGRLIAKNKFSLQSGSHNFRIQIANAGIYFLTARQNSSTSTIKMVNNGGGAVNAVECVGMETLAQNANQTSSHIKGGTRGSTTNPFSYGDQMEYVGYATINDAEIESQHIQQVQDASQSITLQFFVDGQPCPNAATVTDYDGNVYNTVLIGQQCWMRENLKTTHYASGTSIALGGSTSTSTTTAYRYYPSNDSSNVNTYGYLYNWKAVKSDWGSSSSNPSGVQGICPTGWHVPSDVEWTQLTNYVNNQSQYVCDSSGYIAKALASTTGWNSSTENCVVGNNQSSNNATGFSALPAGGFINGFYGFGKSTVFWSVTQAQDNNNYTYARHLGHEYAIVGRYYYEKFYAYSVRCLRD